MTSASVEESFRLFEEFRAEEARNAEKDRYNAEKRAIRLFVLKDRGIVVTSWSEYKHLKSSAFCAKNTHRCAPETCEKKSLPVRQPFANPLSGVKCYASGSVYVCKLSGRHHVCLGLDRCKYTVNSTKQRGTRFCSFSGVCKGAVLCNLLYEQQKGVDMPIGGKGGNEEDDDVDFDDNDDGNDFDESRGINADDDDDTTTTTTTGEGKQRKRRGGATNGRAKRGGGRMSHALLAKRRCAVALQTDTPHQVWQKLSRLMNIPMKSAMDTITGTCRKLLSPEMILTKLRQDACNAESRANSKAAMYMRQCQQQNTQPSVLRLIDIYGKILTPHLARLYPLLKLSGTQRQLNPGHVDYYTEAAIKIWHLLRETPSGSTSKRLNVGVIASSILYRLREGLSLCVHYRKTDRRVVPIPDDVRDKSTLESVIVEFIPQHRFLARLVEESDLRKIGNFTEIMSSAAQIQRCFSSLINSAHTIDTVLAFRLGEYMKFRPSML